MEDEYISVYEYEKNVNPNLQSTPFYEKDINTCNYGINIVDFSNIYKSSHKSTTPNLLASFIKLEKSDNIELNNNKFVVEFNATSHIFYVINGNCTINIDNNYEKVLHSGDLLVSPCFNLVKINNISEVVCWGDGSPKREFLYVDDLADACLLCMLKYESDEIINIMIFAGIIIINILFSILY